MSAMRTELIILLRLTLVGIVTLYRTTTITLTSYRHYRTKSILCK